MDSVKIKQLPPFSFLIAVAEATQTTLFPILDVCHCLLRPLLSKQARKNLQSLGKGYIFFIFPPQFIFILFFFKFPQFEINLHNDLASHNISLHDYFVVFLVIPLRFMLPLVKKNKKKKIII